MPLLPSWGPSLANSGVWVDKAHQSPQHPLQSQSRLRVTHRVGRMLFTGPEGPAGVAGCHTPMPLPPYSTSYLPGPIFGDATCARMLPEVRT